MSAEPRVSEEDLHAFIDGELETERERAIEKAIQADPALSALVEALMADKMKTAQLHWDVPERPLPAVWVRTIKNWAAGEAGAAPHRPAPWFFSRRVLAALAAVAVLLVTLGFGLSLLNSPSDTIIAEAFAARDRDMRPEEVLPAAAVPSADERNQVLANALAMAVKAPDLSKLGYRLDDIRIYSGIAGGKAAELSYRDAQDHLFTLYLRHPSGPARVDLLQRNGMRICIWQDEDIGTVMLGEMSAGEMARLASLAYSGLTL